MPPPDNQNNTEDFMDDDDDDNYEPFRPFGEEVYDYIASPIKQFLINYVGEALNNAEPETFRAIEESLKEDTRFEADMIPDILYRYCTIKDSKEWDKAFDDFKPVKDAVYPWPELEKWYNRPDDEDDEDDDDEPDEMDDTDEPGNTTDDSEEHDNEYDDDEYDEDEETGDEEMPEEAKRIIDHIDNTLNEHHKFKAFLNECCAVIITETRKYLEKNASFDLTNLTEEGYQELQSSISFMAETIAENLHAQVADILSGPADKN